MDQDLVDRALARVVATRASADVVDIGGGSGTRAVPLAQAGCSVLVVDASTDALASLSQRAHDAGVEDRITALQADADQLGSVVPAASVDLVLYHHVVQEVDDPARSLAAAVEVLRPGGTLSIVVPGRLAATLAAAVGGRYDEALTLLTSTADTDRHYDVPALRSLMEQAGLAVESVTGMGVASVLTGHRAEAGSDPNYAELEHQLERHAILGQIAGDLHGLGMRPVR